MENEQDFVIENGVLTKYNGPGGNVVIPAGVTKIGRLAFSECRGLTSVSIPENVTEIGFAAFSSCAMLSSVSIPAGVTEIGDWVFYGCTGLVSVSIPESVTEIGVAAFSGCRSLTSVSIPASVTKIREEAFIGCAGLTSVSIPAGVTEIGNLAFYGCTGLTGMMVLGTVKIHKNLFDASRPMLIAPHIPITDFDKEDKPGACCGFAKAYLDGMELDEEIKAGYLKYIKNQKKKLYSAAVQHEALLQLMFAEKMIPRKDIDMLLEECDKQENPTAKAFVLECAHQFLNTADPDKKYRL